MAFRINRGIFQRFDTSSNTFINKFKIDSDGVLKEVDENGDPIADYLKSGDKASDANTLDGIDSSAFVRSNTNDTISSRIDFSAAESIRLHGVRGKFTNEYIHLYHKVGVGHPSGWGEGEGDTPGYGLSTYGGLNIAYGNNAGSSFNGAVDVNGYDFSVKNGRILITNPSATGGGNFDPTTLAFGAREHGYGRAQLLLASGYSDLTIGSSQANDNHGSTLTFATVNPSNGADYRKFVIGQGNWGSRSGHLDFGYDSGNESKNPHDYINSTDVVFTIDADDNRVGVNSMNPSHGLDVNGNAHISSTLEVDDRIYADNGLHVRADWLRVNGNNGIYFESHGGGWSMTDSSWIRAYNNKGIYTAGNIEVGGTSRADNGFKVGGDTVIDSNRNITANTSVQIGAYVMRHNTENNRLEFALA
jgi:hypothetical protein